MNVLARCRRVFENEWDHQRRNTYWPTGQIRIVHSKSHTPSNVESSDRLSDRRAFFETKRDAYASPRDVQGLLTDDAVDCQLVDVRVGPPELLEERLPGAIHVPAPAVVDRLDAFSADATIVVYCWDTWCSLATRAAIPLLERGYDVRELHGGVAAWNALELPTEPVESTAPTVPLESPDDDCGC